MDNRNTVDRFFSPLDLRQLYPRGNNADVLADFTDDITGLADELADLAGVIRVSGAVYYESIPASLRFRLSGELHIEETGDFHQEAFDAKLDLLAEGFMFVPSQNKWIVAGIL